MISSDFTRLTPFVFIRPQSFIDEEAVDDLDFKEWSRDFSWRIDAWNGLRDTAQPVEETVKTNEGDCEDYALVAASWAISQGYDNVGLALCFEGVVPNHVIAYDDERVYSSGVITRESVDDWTDKSYKWKYTIKRSITND